MRRVVLLAVVVLVIATASCSDSGNNESTPTTVAATYRLDDSLRLDQVQVLGSHNSYHARPYPEVLEQLRSLNVATAMGLDYAHAPLPEQFDLGVRQIELDVYDDPNGGAYADPGLARQLGVDVPDDPAMKAPGYKVIHQASIDTHSTCLTFVACLQLLKTWSDAHPGHVAINVLVEMKDPEVNEAMFGRLERDILSVFDRSSIITPDDVRGDARTLGEAVRASGWPTLGATRGKVYFALDNEGLRDTYRSGHPSLERRLLFTASKPGEPDAAFAKLNDPTGDAENIKAALAAHMIVRTRADADTVQARANDTTNRTAALNGGAQLVSTDYEQPDPTIDTGYVVTIPGGAPARCNPVTAPRDCRPLDVEDPALLATYAPAD
jgi:hypothetical protein